MKILIIPRSDDGTFDLFEKTPNGRLNFLSNHDSEEEAIAERESYAKPLSKIEALNMLGQMKQSLNNYDDT